MKALPTLFRVGTGEQDQSDHQMGSVLFWISGHQGTRSAWESETNALSLYCGWMGVFGLIGMGGCRCEK